MDYSEGPPPLWTQISPSPLSYLGNPHLEKHVAVVTALMRISPGWSTFMKNFNRNFRPHIPEQRDLFEEFEAEEREAADGGGLSAPRALGPDLLLLLA